MSTAMSDANNTRTIASSALAWVVAGLVALPCAMGLTPATLIDTSLKPVPIRLRHTQQGMVSFFDQTRALQRESLRQYVAIEFDRDRPRPVAAQQGIAMRDGEEDLGARPVRVDLHDGQRIVGLWLPESAADDQQIVLRHRLLGDLVVSLDQLAQLDVLDGQANLQQKRPLPPQVNDQIVLDNGDVLAGFVEAISSQGVAISIGNDPATIAGASRIVRIRLAGVAASEPAGGDRLLLVDGTAVDTSQWTIERDHISLAIDSLQTLVPEDTSHAQGKAPGNGRVSLALDELRGVELRRLGHRRVALTSKPYQVEPDGEHPLALPALNWPTRVGRDGSLSLHGPTRVVFELGDNARHVAVTLRLALPEGDPNARRWADCDVIITAGDKSQRIHLDAKSPVGKVNIPVSDRRLELTIEPGLNGAVFDRVMLQDAVVLEYHKQQPGLTGE